MARAEFRNEWPLATLPVALETNHFMRRVQFLAANSNTSASEPAMIRGMLMGLHTAPAATVVMDAQIAAQCNLAWLRQQSHH